MANQPLPVELRIPAALSKRLKRTLRALARQEDIRDRLDALERRVEQLERQDRLPTAINAPTEPIGSGHHAMDPGIFFNDADDIPPATKAQQDLYEAWRSHFERNPGKIEAGKTAHEMAALKAATRSPIGTAGIDQQP